MRVFSTRLRVDRWQPSFVSPACFRGLSAASRLPA